MSIYIAGSVTVISLKNHLECVHTTRRHKLVDSAALCHNREKFETFENLVLLCNQLFAVLCSLRDCTRLAVSLTSFRIWLARQKKCFLFHFNSFL
jgi:hypothetical protein